MSISSRKAGTFVECLRCHEKTQVPMEDAAPAASSTSTSKSPVTPETPKPARQELSVGSAAPAERAAAPTNSTTRSPKEAEPISTPAAKPAQESLPSGILDEIFKDIDVEDTLSKPAARFAPKPLPARSTPKPPLPPQVETSPPPELPTVAPVESSPKAEVDDDAFDELFDPIARDEHEDALEQLHRSESTMVLPHKPDEDSYVPEEIFQEEDEARPVQFRRKRTIDDEMDLTPMVDVTFQLLIFFMVSASFSLQKSIEVPTPDPESKGASQQVKTMDDLQGTSIVVKIDSTNAIWLDDEPLNDSKRLADTLRDKMRREQKTELLISANSQSLHRTVISVIDAANEIGVQKIRMSSSKKSE